MESLVLWEVSQKQNYIFSSNILRENIGASIIVEKVVDKLPVDVNPAYKENLIYNGGGSSLYKFHNNSEAKDFIKNISERILKEYPGIEVFMVIVDFDNKKEKITEVIDLAYRKLGSKKTSRKNSGRQISFGIERLCDSTGLPAIKKEMDHDSGERRYISEEIDVKLDNSNDRNKKFSDLILNKPMTKSFRDMAKGDKNYMAVVHIDGNKMGEKFDELKKEFHYEEGNYENTNNEYIKALKDFSNNIKAAYENSFMAMARAIEKNKLDLENDTRINKDLFPLIPIIVAGDDISFITNGKIGLETSRVFLEYLYGNEIEIYKGKKIKLNACAGVAIVSTSYPFVKAYQLAEDLCTNGKKKLMEEYPNRDFSLIDWHIEQGDLMGSIDEIRRDNYMDQENKKDLFMRPLYINNEDEKNWKNYHNFKEAYHNVKKREILSNKISGNKIKELREILKKGESETELFLKSNGLDNYLTSLPNTLGDYCFAEDACMYYDAIEIGNLFLELHGEENRDE